MTAPPATATPPAPAPAGELEAGRSAGGGWLPAAVLAGGLALTAAAVASASGVSVSALHRIHADAASLHDVAKVYNGWASADFDPFADHRLRALTVLLTVAYLWSVTALGSVVVGAMRGSERWPRAVRLLGGFLPGYLMVLAPLQLVFAAAPLVTAAWISVAGVTIAALVAGRRSLAGGLAPLSGDRLARRRWGITTAGVAGVVVLAALHRLQAGRNFMVSDSVQVLLDAAHDQLLGGAGAHLLQWDQQSDEWVFSAPLMFTSHAGADYLFPLYAAQCLGLASFACLVFGIVHTLAWRRRTVAASVATGAILLSTPAIYPWYYISLVGGQNPAIWLGHPGRFIGIVAPWAALLLLARHRGRAAVAVGFATLGLGFASVHVALYVLAALGAALAWTVLRGRRPQLSVHAVPRAAVHLLAAAALAAPAFAYWLLHQVATPSSVAWWLVGGAAIATVAALLVALAAAGHRSHAAPGGLAARAFAWAAALVVGFLLSNNLTDGFAKGHLRSALAAVLPGYDTPLASRSLLGDTPVTGLSFPTFTGQECSISGHCVSPGYFLAAYGFVLVVALAGWVALGPMSSDGAINGRRVAWLIMVGSLGLSLALVDFSGAPLGTAWVLTRFIEVPYYGLLALGAMAFAAARNRVTTGVGLGVLALWTVIPIVVNLVPLQLVRNAHWLARAVAG